MSDAKKPTESSEDDQRQRFQAALQAKKGRTPGNPHAQASSGGAPKEHSSRSGGKREFRRKSGG